MRKMNLRSALLVTLVVLTAFAMRQVAAATISDLGEFYVGSTHSHFDPDSEIVDAEFTVDTINRSSFTGVFADGRLEFEVRGTVSRTGKVTFSGKFEEEDEKLGSSKVTIRGSGQLSATGGFFLGTATEQGKLEDERFKDSISFALQNDDFVEELGAAAKKAKK